VWDVTNTKTGEERQAEVGATFWGRLAWEAFHFFFGRVDTFGVGLVVCGFLVFPPFFPFPLFFGCLDKTCPFVISSITPSHVLLPSHGVYTTTGTVSNWGFGRGNRFVLLLRAHAWFVFVGIGTNNMRNGTAMKWAFVGGLTARFLSLGGCTIPCLHLHFTHYYPLTSYTEHSPFNKPFLTLVRKEK